MRTKLIVLSGLPGSGKSIVAERLSAALSLPVVSIDPIEAAMWRAGIPHAMTGIAAYEVARAAAEENVRLGISIVVDAVNPVEAAREMWRSLAREQGARLLVIECVCSDTQLHRQRIENRTRNIPGMAEVTWERVEERRREYEPWVDNRLVLDTAQDVAGTSGAAISYVMNG
jgi:predicted kinase